MNLLPVCMASCHLLDWWDVLIRLAILWVSHGPGELSKQHGRARTRGTGQWDKPSPLRCYDERPRHARPEPWGLELGHITFYIAGIFGQQCLRNHAEIKVPAIV